MTLFEMHAAAGPVVFDVPSMQRVWCFLERQRNRFAEEFDGAAVDTDVFDAFESLLDAAEELWDDTDDGSDEASDDDLDGTDDPDMLDGMLADVFGVDDTETDDAGIVWQVAALFGIGQHAPTWWLLDDAEHGSACECRPMGLLEVLQYHATGQTRQAALEAHLGALQAVWDHFWSGDALVNGSSQLINGACAGCITDGHPHLEIVLDEARNLAEELGEALAAFHSQIDIGLDRY